MRNLLALFVLTFATNTMASDQSPVYSCISEDNLLVKFNTYYGELSVMDKSGNLILDYDDGYNVEVLQLEVFPPITSVVVTHHEEPEKVVMSMSRTGDFGAYSGEYTDYDGKTRQLTCL